MADVADAILANSIRHKLGLLRLENSIVRRIIALLNRSDRDLLGKIVDAVDRGASVDSVRRLKAIRAELKMVNNEAYVTASRGLSAVLKDLSVREVDWSAGMIEREVPIAFSMTRPSRHLLTALVVSNPFQGALLRDHMAKLAGNRLSALTNDLEIGLVEGESISQLMARVRGTRRNKYRDGILHNVGRRQLETIVRSAAQHTTETARELLIQENDDIIDGTMWVNTLDHRTCRVCQPRGGLVWSWSSDNGYQPDGHSLPWNNGPGRIHFQCRCTAIPVLKGFDELAKKAGVDLSSIGPQERSALNRPVPVNMDYEEWLRGESKEIQILALGARRAELFRNDQGTLDEIWARRFLPNIAGFATLDEIFP